MVGTRSAGGEKRRSSRRGATEEEPITLNAMPPSSSFADDQFPPSCNGNVPLRVTGHWNPPPSIGEIEAVFMAKGRAQHRICKIEVRDDCAMVEVHADDVPKCVGVIQLGKLEVRPHRPSTRTRSCATHARFAPHDLR